MASTNMGSSGAAYHRGVTNVGSLRPFAALAPAPSANTYTARVHEQAATTERIPSLMAVRASEALPAGYAYVIRDIVHLPTHVTRRDTVDLTTPPDGREHGGGGERSGCSKIFYS